MRGLVLFMEQDGLDGEVVDFGNPEEHTLHEVFPTTYRMSMKPWAHQVMKERCFEQAVIERAHPHTLRSTSTPGQPAYDCNRENTALTAFFIGRASRFAVAKRYPP